MYHPLMSSKQPRDVEGSTRTRACPIQHNETEACTSSSAFMYKPRRPSACSEHISPDIFTQAYDRPSSHRLSRASNLNSSLQPILDVYGDPSGSSLADPSVTELLTSLDEQISDESSALRTGNVTSAANGLAYTTSVVADSTSTDSSATAIGLSVVEYQPKGLFGFTQTIWYTTEASGTVTLTIKRDHGSKGVMDIGYSTSDGSATGSSDYTSVAGNIIRFYEGDTSKMVDISLVDDTETEAHFESFTVALSLQGPINEGAAMMATAAEATVFLYDYGDGVVLADATFFTEATSASAAESGMEDFALGWTISDNGGHSGWVDSNGFAAKDAVFGADEYGRFYGRAWCGYWRTYAKVAGFSSPLYPSCRVKC